MSAQHMFGDPSNSSSQPNPGPPSPTRSTHRADSISKHKLVQITSHNQYTSPRLTREILAPSPLEQFRTWFAEAQSPPNGLPAVAEPEATCISTSTAAGIPSARMVLLRGVDERGFVFFTNYTSRKSRELIANPHASMTFYWKEQARQIRVVGTVEKVEREESESYFATRPRGSQLGAWASQQSKEIGETTLQDRLDKFEKEFEGKEVDCPEHWGGWRIDPFEIEFWSGHTSRLHDRFRYLLQDNGEWKIDRLSP
ncbi:hypothetical protein EHS25_004087 [Saitozyma podzolica]|uniref:pyridoxal 5'-phosphate synthase n=1 Tax=Saitozyma podzolica TaxID=1890683 RepID=A0A427YT30_9TREE|nr:hypothetical protein EHS25_004087 [Saitozyma podzolica]